MGLDQSLGWLVAEQAGMDLGLSPNTLTSYRKIARELNITSTDLGIAFTRSRLDYETAAVEQRVA